MCKSIILAFSSVFAVAGTIAGQIPSAVSARDPEVVATGTVELHTPPTFADVTITVTTNAGSVVESASQNATKMASTMNALRQSGIAPEDITTQGYSIDQVYDSESRRRVGFTARNALLIRINHIDRIGSIIDAAVSGGATDISAIQYGSAIMDEVRRNAMAEAVKRTRADAALIADAAGGTLGRLISITSSAGGPRGSGGLSDVTVTSAVASAGPPTNVIAPKNLSAFAQASGRWEFVPRASH
jgi:uncharacterized protein